MMMMMMMMTITTMDSSQISSLNPLLEDGLMKEFILRIEAVN